MITKHKLIKIKRTLPHKYFKEKCQTKLKVFESSNYCFINTVVIVSLPVDKITIDNNKGNLNKSVWRTIHDLSLIHI